MRGRNNRGRAGGKPVVVAVPLGLIAMLEFEDVATEGIKRESFCM